MESQFSSKGWRIATLVLRVLTIILLLVSFILLISNVLKVTYTSGKTNTFHFYDVVGFQYMVATIILGLAYSLLQIFYAIRRIKNEDYEGNLLLDFYGDKIVSNLLATGAAAGFIATRERQDSFGEDQKYFGKHFNKSYAAACVLLLAFICTTILSVISSLLATGAAAGFVMTREMQRPFELVQHNLHSYFVMTREMQRPFELVQHNLHSYFSRAYASEVLLLLGFAITEALSIMSSHALHNQNKLPKLSQKEENITYPFLI